MSSCIAKAWAYYRQRGLRELVARIHYRTTFAVFTKALTSTAPQDHDDDVVFRLAGADDASLAAALHSRYEGCRAPHDLPERIRANELTVLGLSPSDPREVLYVSVASRNNRLFRLLPPGVVGPHDACSHGIWVPGPHRGKGIARRGVQFMERAAQQAGTARLWAFVKVSNAASVGLHRTLSYEQFGLFRAGRRFGNRFAQLRPTGSKRWQPLPLPKPDGRTTGPNAAGLPGG